MPKEIHYYQPPSRTIPNDFHDVVSLQVQDGTNMNGTSVAATLHRDDEYLRAVISDQKGPDGHLTVIQVEEADGEREAVYNIGWISGLPFSGRAGEQEWKIQDELYGVLESGTAIPRSRLEQTLVEFSCKGAQE